MKYSSEGPSKRTIRKKVTRARRRIAGHKLVRPNHILEPIVGDAKDTRPAMIGKVMIYVERNQLFDPSAPNLIVADENLKELFLGQARVHRNDVHRYVTLSVLPGIDISGPYGVTLSVLPGIDISDPDGVPIKTKAESFSLTKTA
jgi:chromatin remodeling complex protein RSC6